MNKIKIGLISAILTMIIATSTYAFIPPPPGPGTPTIDPVSNVVVFIDNAQVAVQNTTAQMSAYVQGINQKAKAMLNNYVGKFNGFMGGIFKKKEKQPLPGTKEISEAKVADIYDPLSVQQALYKMFLQYPVDCTDKTKDENFQICEQYKKAAVEFYQDTVIEIYTSMRELEKQFDTIETSINEVETALQEGKSGAESTEDDLGVWKNAYNAYETMNSLLKIIEEMEAMKAQYIAAQAIGSGALIPDLPESKKDKGALNTLDLPIQKMAQGKIFSKTTLSFAALTDEEEKEDNPTYKKAVEFVDMPASGLKDPFAENAENIKLLKNVYEAYDYLSEAIEVHNQIKNLESIRHVYDGYEKARRLHQKALEALKTSEECAINYYSVLYENPREMWNGDLSDEQLPDQEAHKGIAGWAIKAYTLAKAEDTGIIVDAEDFSELNADTNNFKAGDISQINANAGLITKDSAGFKDAAQKEKVNAELKASELIPWHIGAEAAKMIARDQSKWGKVKKAYPIWKDTQAYYNQYLDGKYNNIINRLEMVNTNDVALEIAEKLNHLVSSQEEYEHNADALAALKEKVKNLKSNAEINIEALVKEKEGKLNELYEFKERMLARLKQRKDNNINEINNIQIQLDALNLKLQTANDNKIKAEATVKTLEEQVKALYRKEFDIPDAEMINFETEEYQKDLNAVIGGQQSYNGHYQSHQKLAYAQLFNWFGSQKKEETKQMEPLSSIEEDPSLVKPDVRTYEKEVGEIKNIEIEESNELLTSEAQLAENRELVLATEKEIAELNKQIEELTKQQEALYKEITDEIEPEEKRVQEQYVTDFNEMTLAYDKQINEAENNNLETLKQTYNLDLAKYFAEHYSIPTTTVLGEVYAFSLPEILQQANDLVNDARGTARELVKATLKQMYALGEGLYHPKNHEKIVEYHKQLMTKLKELPASDLKSYGEHINAHAGVGGLLKLLQTIYQSYILTDACLHDYCMESDNAYYVSMQGKRRDFKAPFDVPSYPLPSVREVVHFDYTIYDRIPSQNGTITVPDLLKTMSYVPEIWRQILTSPAYVEKDIDLSSIIIPSQERLANAGIYPCIQDDYIVTSDGEKYILYGTKPGFFGSKKTDDKVAEELKKLGYTTCLNLEITAKGPYLMVRNIADDVSGTAEVRALSSFKPAENNSELGYLFEYNNGLKYNKLAENSFKRLSDMEREANVEGGQKELLYAYNGLNRNQIGEFLHTVDLEQTMRQNMDELKVELKSTQETLTELFTKIGFEPSTDFNLAKESDYTLARNTLMRYRNKLLSAAIATTASVQNNDNEVIAERMVKINHLIGALKKDNDAYVSLGELSEDNAELDESIKAEKVNREVSERQRKSADEDFEKQLQKIGNVFCGQLIDNM